MASIDLLNYLANLLNFPPHDCNSTRLLYTRSVQMNTYVSGLGTRPRFHRSGLQGQAGFELSWKPVLQFFFGTGTNGRLFGKTLVRSANQRLDTRNAIIGGD